MTLIAATFCTKVGSTCKVSSLVTLLWFYVQQCQAHIIIFINEYVKSQSPWACCLRYIDLEWCFSVDVLRLAVAGCVSSSWWPFVSPAASDVTSPSPIITLKRLDWGWWWYVCSVIVWRHSSVPFVPTCFAIDKHNPPRFSTWLWRQCSGQRM